MQPVNIKSAVSLHSYFSQCRAMVFIKAKVKQKKEQSSRIMTQYNDTQRELKRMRAEEAEECRDLPMLITQGGRRIIDLIPFAKNMWCHLCKVPLSLRNLLEEEHFGVASRFRVRCHVCLQVHAIDTSATVPDTSKEGRSLFAVNCKLAIGMSASRIHVVGCLFFTIVPIES